MKKKAWSWVPTLYFAEGLPYTIVMTLSVIMYKRFGMSNEAIAFYTGWFYLPWVIKPFWSPFVEIVRTKRWWILSTQLLIGAGFASIALSLPTPFYIQASMAMFWLVAFSSATHDISADGFYILALDNKEQSFFVGIRSTFYRLSTIFAQGFLVFLAGILESHTGNIKLSWSIIFFITSGIFIGLYIYHKFVLPQNAENKANKDKRAKEILKEFVYVFRSFFSQKNIIIGLTFMLTYRLSEAMLVKITSPFLLDPVAKGGMGLSTSEVGIYYGTFGVIALLLGGILGGMAISKKGLKHWFIPMTLALTLPNAVYLLLSIFQPDSRFWVASSIVAEQFGYGFGFTAYMMYLIEFSKGEYKTAHYSICTGFMALGMMIPGMISGVCYLFLGYKGLFTLIMLLVIPTIAIAIFTRKTLK